MPELPPLPPRHAARWTAEDKRVITLWGAECARQALSSRPPYPYTRDHEIAVAVNELRDIALQYHATQQLRERISRVVVDLVRRR